jgi:molybdate transport system substrate-binding protein
MIGLKVNLMRISLYIISLLVILGACKPQQDELTLFAGVGMSDVVTEIANVYKEQCGTDVRLSLASSAVLAGQMEAGATADVVIFASKNWADYAENQGLVIKESVENYGCRKQHRISCSQRKFYTTLTHK